VQYSDCRNNARRLSQSWQSGARSRAGHMASTTAAGSERRPQLCAPSQLCTRNNAPAGRAGTPEALVCSFSSCDMLRRPIPVRRHGRLYQRRLGTFRLVTKITARHLSRSLRPPSPRLQLGRSTLFRPKTGQYDCTMKRPLEPAHPV
jgi:hypothetical protein